MGKKKLALTTIAPTALIHPSARIGRGTKIWAFAQVAEHAVVGRDCTIGNGAYIDRHVKIGNRVRIHNKALLYHGVIVEDDVFIGPGVCFTNDSYPTSRSTRNLKGKAWYVRTGASIGANATILPDLEIGENSIVGAGSVVTKNVPPNAIVCGNPARVLKRVRPPK
jgi:UDP-2-acetamido-3-amino-2,3-dideoxy-glucuronate N-acetyltransferase